MSILKTNTIKAFGSKKSKIDFPNDLYIGDSDTTKINREYYEQSTEPTSPGLGALWWDTTNEELKIWVGDVWGSLDAATPYTFQGTVSGYTSGGSPFPDVIDKFPFAADANATDVGDLSVARDEPTGQSSSENGYTSGGFPGPKNTIDKFPFAADANATDVGDLTQARRRSAGQSSENNGYTSGGGTPTLVNTIDKFPFAADANATDVGDLTQARYFVTGQSSSINGYSSGGLIGNPAPSPPQVNTIDKFPFATDANATDVGDLTELKNWGSGQSSEISGYISGGQRPPPVTRSNVIEKFPFATDANATDVGDLTALIFEPAGQSSTDNGYSSGGTNAASPPVNVNVIEKFPFASDANATDVGDLTQARSGPAGQQV